ncbi:hypothetical protein OJ997_01870 [Solirubrobacter phytolaccae]|uniref:Uncharacterized protein n=1 Tax=Solirubrobacter phytolaccae TaxID=1404360 RepID=A0A9X3N3Y6_9ACTN|nr:hypothetical protein [Solirubrobacter phytolaccae]MDA0179026.1 hypothetical protein [Solirubrobacter phytolaccae]
MAADDEDLIREALRAVLASDGSNSGKALEAKASAARALGRLNGMDAFAKDGAVADEFAGLPPDPFADMDEWEAARLRRGGRPVGRQLRATGS